MMLSINTSCEMLTKTDTSPIYDGLTKQVWKHFIRYCLGVTIFRRFMTLICVCRFTFKWWEFNFKTNNYLYLPN